MQNERRVILSLVAMGRITPREAERLMMAASNEDDVLLRMMVLLSAAWLALPQIGAVLTSALHTVAALAPVWARWMGGVR